jgi:hypothetical protein
MKRRFLFFLSISLVVVLMAAVFFLQRDAVEAKDGFKGPHPLAGINQKAKDVRSGNSSDANAYVAEILKVAKVESELPQIAGVATSTIVDRVANAELNYRDGRSEGIDESRIVRTVNGLALRLGLPEYAYTDVYEVRRLRLMMLPNFPEIIGRKSASQPALTAGSTFDSKMSPAETLLIFTMMLQQKQYNPEFQLTRGERQDLWSEIHDRRPGRDFEPNVARNRNVEIQTALRRSGESMRTSDLLSLSDITLNTLGIEHEGGQRR